MFEELNDKQRNIVWAALDGYGDLCYDKGDLDEMKEVNDLIRELDRIGTEDERTHTEQCPNLYGIGHVCADIDCPECGKHGYHPTKGCPNCGHHLCWCVKE